MEELILYNYFRSSTSFRVRIALHFKNISFTYMPLHLLNQGGEQNLASYKSINPMSEVPTIVHEGLTLSQSMAILEYLEDFYPNPNLFPKEAHLRARVRQFCENINSFMHPLTNLKVLQYLEKSPTFSAEKKTEWAKHWLQMGFEATESLLKKTAGTYCFSDHITAADMFLVPQVFSSKRFQFDMTPFPIVNRIYSHCLLQNAFKKAHPFRQIDTPEEEKIS